LSAFGGAGMHSILELDSSVADSQYSLTKGSNSMSTSTDSFTETEAVSFDAPSKPAGPAAGGPGPHRPLGASSKFAGKRVPIRDAEVALREQLRDPRYLAMRSEMSQEFLENLVLPDERATVARAAGVAAEGESDDPLDEIPIDEPTTDPKTVVDGNAVETFLEGLRGQHLKDAANSTLLAQLASNVKFDRESQPIEWTRNYTSVLENIAWVVPEFSFFGLKSSQKRFSMDSAILKVIKAIMTQQQVEIVQASFEALQALNSSDNRLTIFRRNSVQNNVGNFQINGVGESTSGIVSMKLNAFHFKTDESVTDVLWFRFNSGSTTLNATRTTLVLNEEVYAQLRDPIVKKLGARAKNYIDELPIGD
jgi:hypothetical protein